MSETYKLGTFNASLFATEGIASVGHCSRQLPCSFVGSSSHSAIAFHRTAVQFHPDSGAMLPRFFSTCR